jgi:hypothetical protein
MAALSAVNIGDNGWRKASSSAKYGDGSARNVMSACENESSAKMKWHLALAKWRKWQHHAKSVSLSGNQRKNGGG